MFAELIIVAARQERPRPCRRGRAAFGFGMAQADDLPIDSEKAAACWESHRPRWYPLEKLDSTQSPEMEDPASLRKYLPTAET